MEIIAWIAAGLSFAIAFAGLVYPVIPSALFIMGGFLFYGWIDSFEGMNVLFWIIQILFLVLLFGADTLSNLVGVKKFGGSKAGMWGARSAYWSDPSSSLSPESWSGRSLEQSLRNWSFPVQDGSNHSRRESDRSSDS